MADRTVTFSANWIQLRRRRKQEREPSVVPRLRSSIPYLGSIWKEGKGTLISVARWSFRKVLEMLEKMKIQGLIRTRKGRLNACNPNDQTSTRIRRKRTPRNEKCTIDKMVSSEWLRSEGKRDSVCHSHRECKLSLSSRFGKAERQASSNSPLWPKKTVEIFGLDFRLMLRYTIWKTTEFMLSTWGCWKRLKNQSSFTDSFQQQPSESYFHVSCQREHQLRGRISFLLAFWINFQWVHSYAEWFMLPYIKLGGASLSHSFRCFEKFIGMNF